MAKKKKKKFHFFKILLFIILLGGMIYLYGTYIEINNAHGSIPQSRIVLAQRAPISNDDPNSAVRPARLEFAICPAVTGDRLNLFRNHRDNTAYPDILGPNPPLLLRTQAFFLYPVPVRHAQIRRI